MNRVFLLVVFLGMTVSLSAQKANFQQAERFRKISSEIGSLRVEANFLEGSEKFWYSYKTSEGIHWYFVDPVRKIKKPLFDNQYMAAELTKLTNKPYSYKQLPINEIRFEKDETHFVFKLSGKQYKYNIETKVLTLVEKPKDTVKKNPKYLWASYSPDSTYMVYARKHNLYMRRVDDKDSVEIQLTTDGEPYYSYAMNERDTTTKNVLPKIRWFKDSKKFYLLREDLRKVGNLWVIDIMSARPRLREYRYAMPGDKHVKQFELLVFDVATQKSIKMNTEKWTDQTMRVIYAPKKSDRILFQRKRRTCDELEICEANTETGECKVLFSEKSKPYFNDQLYHLSVLEDGKDIIWWSERTGWGHFYHYDQNGNLKNAISSGNWVAGKMVRIDTVGRTIYFEGYGRDKGMNPYYTCIYKANIDSGEVQLLTPEDANHQIKMSESGRFFVDNYSRVDLEPRSVLRNNKGEILMELERPDLKRLYEIGWRMPERFTVKAKDGVTDLYGVMWKPADFDSTKKYPIISYVYPGPQTESVPENFTISGTYNNALAQVGFIVVHFGHRGGSPKRDKWYHTYGYDNLRDYPLADDKYGIEQLADRYDFIDITKVGIFGHSGGGFMSTAALCTYPDFYTAAVSSAGNHDNNIYNQWWGETHNGVREEKKTIKDTVKGDYEESTFKSQIATNANLVKNLKGHLLLVTGDVDDNVHPSNTLRLAHALIRAGKNFDFIVLPTQGHAFYDPYVDFYQRKMWFHFAKYLLGDASGDYFFDIDAFNRRK